MSTKKIFLLALILIFGSLAAAISLVVLAVFLISVLVMAILRWLPKQTERARPIWYFLIIVGIVSIVIFVPFVRSHPPASCQDSIRGFAGRTMDKPRTTLERVSANPQSDFLRTIDAEGLELLQHAAASKKAGVVLDSALKTEKSLSADLSSQDITNLDHGITGLRSALKGLSGDGLEKRTQRLNEFVSKKREEAKKAQDQQAFLDKFEIDKADETWSFEDVYSKMVGLQDLVTQFVNSKAKEQISPSTVRLTARLEEPEKEKNTVVYEERIGITFDDNITLRQIDFSELQLKEKFSGMDQSILYSFDAAQPVRTNSASISVPDQVHKLTVLNQVRTSANLGDACNGARLLPFHRFIVIWPDATPTSIGLQMDVANLGGHGGSVPYYFRLPIDKKHNIDEIKIPKYSFFNSNYSMKEDKTGMPAGITPDPPVSAADSSVSQPIEIELLPESYVFRNSPVQERKRYLFPLNALVFFSSLLLGSLFSLLVDPKKKLEST